MDYDCEEIPNCPMNPTEEDEGVICEVFLYFPWILHTFDSIVFPTYYDILVDHKKLDLFDGICF